MDAKENKTLVLLKVDLFDLTAPLYSTGKFGRGRVSKWEVQPKSRPLDRRILQIAPPAKFVGTPGMLHMGMRALHLSILLVVPTSFIILQS